MLYLLTYADMSCVSLENWTVWKANLLRALYEKTHATMLAEGLGAPEHAQSIEARRQRLADRLAPLAGDQAKLAPEFVRELPERYLITALPEIAARHLRLWAGARKAGFAADLHRSAVGEADLTRPPRARPGRPPTSPPASPPIAAAFAAPKLIPRPGESAWTRS